MILEIKDLHIEIEGKEIVKGINLKIESGQAHVIMGPNGSGKSTLAKAIVGYPGVKITRGDILVDGSSILALKADQRAKLGLFMQFQNPVEIEGVGFVSFLHASKSQLSEKVDAKTFMKDIKESSEKLKLGDIVGRSLNHGFSGGEKKKAEILQLSLLRPKMAILDEPDSGLDIDAIKLVANSINDSAKSTGMGMLVITHYNRILSYMQPEFVHVMVDGKIVSEGGKALINKLEKEGYKAFYDHYG